MGFSRIGRLVAPFVLLAPLHSAAAVSFSREVLPLLSEKCFSCHGQDPSSRMANLRLDTREGATDPRGKRGPAVVPGKPDESPLIARVSPSDPKRIMPPAYSHKDPLTPEQVATLRKWIEDGAPWGRHWSFEPPVRPQTGKGHPVDALVRAQLDKLNLKPAPRAARHTLLRRLSFDLTGLPPTPEEIQAFQNDKSPDAYARQVDRLLASPHFGERMAMWWLDAARYSDTDGFQSDATRTNWPWRDWVVDAFNRNMPFDRFTRDQLAGDLQPNATKEQRLATAFHRNHMTNGEGGRDPEESRIDYVLDRVNATGTIWLGLTLGCAQCHTHKFDPITHNDYYSFSAFFNSIDEDGQAGKAAKPYMKYESPFAARAIAEARALLEERKASEQQARRKAAEGPFQPWLQARAKEVSKGFTAWRLLRANSLESAEGTRLTQDSEGIITASGPNPKQDDYRIITSSAPARITGLKLEIFPHESHTKGRYSRGATGEFILTDIKVRVRRRGASRVREIAVSSAVADFPDDKLVARQYGAISGTLDDDPRNGWTTPNDGGPRTHTAHFELAEPLVLEEGEELVYEMLHRSTGGDANTGRFRLWLTDQPGPAVTSLGPAPLEQLAAAPDLATLDAKVRERLLEQFLRDYPPYLEAKQALARAQRQFNEVKDSGSVDVMVLAERKEPRETHVLLRGVWDKKGEVVKPDTPAAIAPWTEGAPRDRAGLAQWLTSRSNPLTARVVANHLWQLAFGAGLVRTPEDFGLQGEAPTHPELLDWLAVELMDSGWDVKRLLRTIVTSETYQQDSRLSPEMAARDPENRLLARGPRYRLPSWMLRDAALRYAGLMNPVLGGPPVKPYQPEGVWEELFMGRFTYEPSEGPAQYRRTLYAFWRRTIAPTFLFDSAQRRSCEVRTSRTNTPLQALTLLNDANYLEAARVIAANAPSAQKSPEARLSAMFQRVLGRDPQKADLAILLREYDRAATYYRSKPADAKRILQVGQHPGVEDPELAASMVVASMILNLDEAITHE